jgi:integrase
MARQTGIRARHARACRSLDGGRCNCTPTYEAAVYSKRDGKKIRQSFPTETAARQWRADAASAVSRGGMRAPLPITLREAFEAFIAGARDGSVRTKTGHVYKPSVVRRWENAVNVQRDSKGRPVSRRKRGEPVLQGRSLLDELGGRRLADIERRDLQAVVDQLLGWGLDPSSIRNTINALRPVFRRAIARGELIVNPTTGLEIPAPAGKRDRIAAPAEAEALIDAAQARDRGLWACAFYAGLRLGELYALRWEHVDLASGVLHVQASYDPKERELVDVKTAASPRRVPIAAVLRDHLLSHKLETRRSEGLVFGRTAEVPFIGANVQRRSVTAWKRKSLEPIGFHEARHTFASLMIAAGVNVKAISTYMGHASVKITLDRYGHLMPNSEEEATAKLDEYLVRASRAPVRARNERIKADHIGRESEVG